MEGQRGPVARSSVTRDNVIDVELHLPDLPGIQAGIEEGEVGELTDGDLEDPELLAALSALMVSSGSGSDAVAAAAAAPDPSRHPTAIIRSAIPGKVTTPIAEDGSLDREPEEPTLNLPVLRQLEERQRQHKQCALHYKRSGDMVGSGLR